MTQWSCYWIGESVCYWLEKGNSMDTWRRRTHNKWWWRTTLVKSERCCWMTASLYRKYNTFSDRESEQQHRKMTGFWWASKPSPFTHYANYNFISDHIYSIKNQNKHDTMHIWVYSRAGNYDTIRLNQVISLLCCSVATSFETKEFLNAKQRKIVRSQ